MKRALYYIVIGGSLLNTGCSAKMKSASMIGILSGAVGAGVGYTFIHHGKNKEYRTTNTIATSSIFAIIGAGITYWHLTALETQKIDLASKFSRGVFLEEESSRGVVTEVPQNFSLSGQSVALDPSTRWVIPEFRKRELPSERSEQELISSHFSWEIARPGFFISRDKDPTFFEKEGRKSGN